MSDAKFRLSLFVNEDAGAGYTIPVCIQHAPDTPSGRGMLEAVLRQYPEGGYICRTPAPVKPAQ